MMVVIRRGRDNSCFITVRFSIDAFLQLVSSTVLNWSECFAKACRQNSPCSMGLQWAATRWP